MDIDLANPPMVTLESIMAATRGSAREALAEQVGLQRRTEIMASQPSVLEGTPQTLSFQRSLRSYPGICNLW